MARLKGCLFFLLCLIHAINGRQRDPTPYRDSDCPAGGPIGIGVSNGRIISDGNMWASSSQANRQAFKGRLDESSGSWSAKVQDSNQYLSIDLGREYIITAVATQGRQGSGEHVTEYKLAFSTDRSTWRIYTNEDGIQEMFDGNIDSNNIAKKTLKYPVVARYVRFHPQRWNLIISMRVEVYGCPYTSEIVHFTGQGYLYYDLNMVNVSQSSLSDTIKLRFKTQSQNGILLFADGNQGDYTVLQLQRGKLIFSIDLGSTQLERGATDIMGGSMLDDSQWHDVIITRNRTNVKFVVDRLETIFETNGLFYRLNLDKKIYVGGVISYNQKGIEVKYNFDGCIDNVVFNGIKIIRDTKNNMRGFGMGGTNPNPWICKMTAPVPVTFPSYDSYIVMKGNPVGGSVKVQFDFRTHDEDGILLYHVLEDGGIIRAFIDDEGFVNYVLEASGQKIEDKVRNTVDDVATSFADGLWHSFSLVANDQMLNVTVDRNSKVSRRTLQIDAGADYYLGGYIVGIGFRGCMRSIELVGVPVEIASLTESDNLEGVVKGTCGLLDRCTPNPCEHDGVCNQDWDTFVCQCGNTGYTGDVCHRSKYYLSCDMLKMYTSTEVEEESMIDPDGSGPLDPFPVLCSGKEDIGKIVYTKVSHNSEDLITVNGYQAPNFYEREILYDASLDGLEELIKRSTSCEQKLSYTCRNSKLLAKPSESPDPHYGWWVGRTSQPMYYWGGSAPGSGKCACGLAENGCEGGSTTCNCDSSANNTDEGSITHKDYLPIMELHFGDTGTATDEKIAYHKVGKLVCTGDNLLDNVITFRKADASIQLATFDAEPSGDIWFQFKTTAVDGTMVHQTGDPDFIKVALVNGNTVQFSYDVGNGVQVLEYRSTNALNNNQWHTVHVEKNRKQAWLKVDNLPHVSNTEGIGEVTRTLDLTGFLFVGATVEDRNGFVGCLRGLRINGILQDLRGLVHRGEFTYGVSEGCIGKCSSSPCYNGGTCIEGYSGYTCDCAYTPFRGWMCGREVGVNMQKNFRIKYVFDKYQGLSATDFKNVRVGFTTKLKQGILLQLRDETNTEYISLEINNAGGVKFVVDVGSQRFEINTPNHGIDYTNGQQHEVRMWRTGVNGQQINLQVDNYPSETDDLGTQFSDNILNKPKYLFVGNNSTDTTNRGFEGCIFRMQIDNIYPLKRAFQDPRPSFVQLYPTGKVREDMCGYEEVTQVPDPIEIRPIRGGDLIEITYPTPPDQGITDRIIGGVIGAIVFCILVAIIFFVIYFRQKGDYETKEAKGADLAENADVAVVFNQTGVPDIAKRQEFFM